MKYYTCKGKTYMLISEGKMKVDENWVDAVIYIGVNNPLGTGYFCREKEQFYQRFALAADFSH